MRLVIALVTALVPSVAAAQPRGAQRAPPDSEIRIISFACTSTRDSQLGARLIGLNPELETYFGAPQGSGLLVAKVVPGSAAARAGLRVGDVLTTLDGKRLADAGDVLSSLSAIDTSRSVAIDVIRDRQPITMRATLGPQRRAS
jgi:S1-C subfamily serine protease